MALCQIAWIDANGNKTADDNPATCRVKCKARDQLIDGRIVRFSESQWFMCCAEHSKRLNDPGMEIWDCEELRDLVTGRSNG